MVQEIFWRLQYLVWSFSREKGTSEGVVWWARAQDRSRAHLAGGKWTVKVGPWETGVKASCQEPGSLLKARISQDSIFSNHDDKAYDDLNAVKWEFCLSNHAIPLIVRCIPISKMLDCVGGKAQVSVLASLGEDHEDFHIPVSACVLYPPTSGVTNRI